MPLDVTWPPNASVPPGGTDGTYDTLTVDDALIVVGGVESLIENTVIGATKPAAGTFTTATLTATPTLSTHAVTLGYVNGYAIPLTEFGTPNGVATLGDDGKVPTGQLPPGAQTLKGTWNASTNTPTLSSSGGGGVAGDYYIVATAGSTTIDGISSWALNDWIVHATSTWVKQPNSGLPTTTLTAADGSKIQGNTGIMPDLVAWTRDSSGNIIEATDIGGTKLLYSLHVYGATTVDALGAGAISASSVATTGNATIGASLLFSTGDAEQAGSSLTPDLVRWVRDSAGNIVDAFGTDGTRIFNNVQVVGTLTAPNFSGGGGATTTPADMLDITKYGGVGDGFDDVYLGTWSAGANTLTLTKYSGAITWVGTTLTLTGLTSVGVGPGFSFDHVGASIYILATDGSGVAQTVQITGWTDTTQVTVSASPSGAVTTAAVTWPCFTSADLGKSIRVEGGGLALTRQAFNGGVCCYLGTIASVVAGNQVTVTGGVSANFATTNAGRPTRVSWGTDNTSAYAAMEADLAAQGVRYVWHPRNTKQAKTVYCAFKVAQRGVFDTYYWLFIDTGNVYQTTVWLGDATVSGVLTDITGRLMPKRLVPSRSRPVSPVPIEIIARQHMSRGVAATGPVKVTHAGDSLSKYDPTGQSDAWYPMTVFEEMLVMRNTPRKTFDLSGVGQSGVGWSELVDPSTGTPWVVAGTDLYHLSSSGRNDFYRGHPIKVMSGINLARSSGNDGAGRPPDILLTTAAQNQIPPVSSTAFETEGFNHTEILLRSMARCQGLGLANYHEVSEQILHGASSAIRELQQLPNVLGWSMATPFAFATECHSWAAEGVFSSAGQVWTAIGQLVVQLSTMPGNVLIVDSDGSHIRYEVRLWGRSVATTVSTSGATITTAAGTTASGTLTWTAAQNQLTFSAGGFTGKQGQCLLLPGVDISGQDQRTYINQVINDTTAVVDDFWWGAGAGANATQIFSGTVAATVGGQTFIAVDASAQCDVVMTWGSNIYRGKITGYTNANTATLSPAPPALTGQAVQMWIGRVSVPATSSTISSAGTTVTLRFSFDKDFLSLRATNNGETVLFRGPVEHYGNRYYPTFSITGSGVTANWTNLYSDKDVYFAPDASILDLWGNGDIAWPAGGAGGHYSATLGPRISRRVYEAQDLCLL